MVKRPGPQTLSRLRTGPLIREARQSAGLSQAALAVRVGTKQSVVSRWERGVETPRIETLGRILQACGFEADLTFRRHDDEDRSQIRMHLDLTPDERLRYLEDMLEFEELAARARPVEQGA
ncbi:MAG TPA: helix-turn-helix transcriptional regulator [Acidimicrobiia bacterium]|nr:helix-turn-helix transcriptional regulator [Acidimicrobiia bacterium]